MSFSDWNEAVIKGVNSMLGDLGAVPIKQDMRYVLFCDCGWPEHQIIFVWDELFRQYYVSYYLNSEKNFLQRFWTALKYIFGFRSRYGDFGSVDFNQNEANRLCGWLQGNHERLESKEKDGDFWSKDSIKKLRAECFKAGRRQEREERG